MLPKGPGLQLPGIRKTTLTRQCILHAVTEHELSWFPQYMGVAKTSSSSAGLLSGSFLLSLGMTIVQGSRQETGPVLVA